MMIDLRLGDCLTVLRSLESESVHCVVTSPPYWGLRSYGTNPQIWQNGHEPCIEHQWNAVYPAGYRGNDSGDPKKPYLERRDVLKSNTCSICGAWRGELGLEPTPELYVEHLTQIFRECRRVLRDDGTLWLNLGDSYTNNPSTPKIPRAEQGNGTGVFRIGDEKHTQARRQTPNRMTPMRQSGLKPKDLVGIPWMVAFALRADGWYLRSDCIWAKPNPMPESVTDRPTKSHEYIFLLSKSQKYHYDSDAVREPQVDFARGSNGNRVKLIDERPEPGVRNRTLLEMDRNGNKREYNPSGRNRRTVWTVDDERALLEWLTENYPDTAQAFFSMQHERKDVWQIATHPFKGAHFATFPPKLIEPCILAGTSARGVCSKCGAPWERVTERVEPSYYQERKEREFCGRKVEGNDNYTSISKGRPDNSGVGYNSNITTGWRPTCSCDAGEPVPATVLDLFNGAGTTGVVAVEHGRNYIGIDLNSEYLEMTRERISKVQLSLPKGSV